MLNTKNILVLAPHTDDVEFGCGASIAKWIEEGKQVTYIAFSTCVQSLPSGLAPDTLEKECRAATKSLGIQRTIFLDFEVRQFSASRQQVLEKLIELKNELNPETILLPAQNDTHQDHQVIYAEGLRAFKNSNILGYELPWNNVQFRPNYFEKIAIAHLNSKQKSLKEYRSQLHRKYMNEDLIRSLAVVRGIQAGADLAEAFELYRLTSS